MQPRENPVEKEERGLGPNSPQEKVAAHEERKTGEGIIMLPIQARRQVTPGHRNELEKQRYKPTGIRLRGSGPLSHLEGKPGRLISRQEGRARSFETRLSSANKTSNTELKIRRESPTYAKPEGRSQSFRGGFGTNVQMQHPQKKTEGKSKFPKGRGGKKESAQPGRRNPNFRPKDRPALGCEGKRVEQDTGSREKDLGNQPRVNCGKKVKRRVGMRTRGGGNHNRYVN